MIITTGTAIEGKQITEYRGLVFGKSSTADLYIFHDKPKYQEMYSAWVKVAEDEIKRSAENAGANAVIGIRQEVINPKGMLVIMLIGTAVVVE